MSIAKELRAEVEAEAAATRKYVQVIPESKFAWKPHEKSMTLAALAGHIAESPSWIEGMVDDEMDFGAMMADYKPFEPKTRAELEENFEKNLKTFGDIISKMDDKAMNGTWTMRMGEKILMQKPRREVIRNIMINHVAHHRGQLSVYLRMLDVALPAIYGPSADEQTF